MIRLTGAAFMLLSLALIVLEIFGLILFAVLLAGVVLSIIGTYREHHKEQCQGKENDL